MTDDDNKKKKTDVVLKIFFAGGMYNLFKYFNLFLKF